MNVVISKDSIQKWKSVDPYNNGLDTIRNGRCLLTSCDNNNLFLMNSIFPVEATLTNLWYMRTGFNKRTDYITIEEFIKKRVK